MYVNPQAPLTGLLPICSQFVGVTYLEHGESTVKPAIGFAWMETNTMRHSGCACRIEHIDEQDDPTLILVTHKDTSRKFPLPPLPEPRPEPAIPRL